MHSVNTTTVTDATFSEQVLGADGLVLVDFWAEWCGPCKAIAPVLEDLAGERAGSVTVAKLDVDANPDTARSYGVMSIPTLVLLRGGVELERQVGAVPKHQLVEMLDRHA